MNRTMPASTNPILLLCAWAIVILPTAWGLSYTVQSAMKIFATEPAASSAPAPPTTTPSSGSPNTRP